MIHDGQCSTVDVQQRRMVRVHGDGRCEDMGKAAVKAEKEGIPPVKGLPSEFSREPARASLLEDAGRRTIGGLCYVT